MSPLSLRRRLRDLADRSPRLTRAALASAIVLAAFVVANAGFFWKRLTLVTNPPSGEGTLVIPAQPEQAVSAPNWIEIPRLGILAPIVYGEEKNEAAFQKSLQSGVVHYPGTARPGQPGNSYIFGHSSDYGWSPGSYKTVFARLPAIEKGDRITVTDADGRLFFYVVTDTRVIEPDDLSVLQQDLSRSVLTLQTSYPVGTALRRFVAIAELAQDASAPTAP